MSKRVIGQEEFFSMRIMGEVPEVTVLTEGWRPAAEFATHAEKQLRRVFESGPSDATLDAKMFVCDEGFQTTIRMHGSSGEITAKARAGNPDKSLQRALGKIRIELMKWRNARFAEDSFDEVLRATTKPPGPRIREERALELVMDDSLKAKVLIVDDNPLSTKLIQACLRQFGCETTMVSSGEQAVWELTQRDYDLVVLDWVMPEMSGSETLTCAQDLIQYDSTYLLPWASQQMRVLTYSSSDPSEIEFPPCANFERVGHIQKSSTYQNLKAETFRVLKAIEAHAS